MIGFIQVVHNAVSGYYWRTPEIMDEITLIYPDENTVCSPFENIVDWNGEFNAHETSKGT